MVQPPIIRFGLNPCEQNQGPLVASKFQQYGGFCSYYSILIFSSSLLPDRWAGTGVWGIILFWSSGRSPLNKEVENLFLSHTNYPLILGWSQEMLTQVSKIKKEKICWLQSDLADPKSNKSSRQFETKTQIKIQEFIVINFLY